MPSGLWYRQDDDQIQVRQTLYEIRIPLPDGFNVKTELAAVEFRLKPVPVLEMFDAAFAIVKWTTLEMAGPAGRQDHRVQGVGCMYHVQRCPRQRDAFLE